MDFTKTTTITRQMRPEDSGEISRLYGLITQQSVGAGFSELIKAYIGGKDSACFVAECEGRIVGFMIGYLLTMSFGMQKSAWIATMGVDPRFMEQGVGVDLTAEIVKYYKTRGVSAICASVKWNSANSLSLFRTLDFQRSAFINLVKHLD